MISQNPNPISKKKKNILTINIKPFRPKKLWPRHLLSNYPINVKYF